VPRNSKDFEKIKYLKTEFQKNLKKIQNRNSKDWDRRISNHKIQKIWEKELEKRKFKMTGKKKFERI
jgi:hypothetical protein